MHSCGEASAFIPDLIDAGLDVLEALQATTTLDIAKLRAQYGDQITFMGNISSVKMSESDEAIREEIERKVTAGKPAEDTFTTATTASRPMCPLSGIGI